MELSAPGDGVRNVSWERVVDELSAVSATGDDAVVRAWLLELTTEAVTGALAVGDEPASRVPGAATAAACAAFSAVVAPSQGGAASGRDRSGVWDAEPERHRGASG